MSQAPKKKEETNVSGIFSIESDPFADGKVPGVTALLNRKEIEAKANRVTTLEPTRVVNRPVEFQKNKAEPLSLSSLGVFFELQFSSENGVHRFHRATGHLEQSLLPWQNEIFEKMKLDLGTLHIQKNFHEFTSTQNAFLFDAMGIHPQHYVQVICPDQRSEKVVLISKQSLAPQQAKLLEHFSK